jgi:hypothetical protein
MKMQSGKWQSKAPNTGYLGGLSYPFVVDGYEVALYERSILMNNKKRTILWFQVFKKKKPNCS